MGAAGALPQVGPQLLDLERLSLGNPRGDRLRADEAQMALVAALAAVEGTEFFLAFRADPSLMRVNVCLGTVGLEDQSALLRQVMRAASSANPGWMLQLRPTHKVAPWLFDHETVSQHSVFVRGRKADPGPVDAPGFITGQASDAYQTRELLFPFAPGDRTKRDLFSALLGLGQPSVLMVRLTATELSRTEESNARRRLAQGLDEHSKAIDELARSFYERLLLAAPLLEVTTLLSTASPVPPSSLAMISRALSSTPLSDGLPPTPGLDVNRPPEGGAGQAGPLDRTANLMDIVEASALFGLPTPDGGVFPGLAVESLPHLPVPTLDLPSEGVTLGRSSAAEGLPLRLPDADRTRHLYLVGQPGTGKSTLMLNVVLHDIRRDVGVAVFDPHGTLIDDILARIPEERLDDVILVDPSDPASEWGLNLLEADRDSQRELILSELCAMAYQLFDPQRAGVVGPRFEAWTRNAASLLLDGAPDTSTLLDIPRVFEDASFRTDLRRSAGEAAGVGFWSGTYDNEDKRTRDEFIGWFTSKFEVFRANPAVRRFVGRNPSSIDLADVMRDRRILLVDLEKGRLGSYNAALIGFVVFTRLWTAALARTTAEAESSPFMVHADEFHSFTTSSLPLLLAEARKFGVGLTLAHQYLAQVDDSLRHALAGAVSNRVVFRIGGEDREWLARELGPDLTGRDLAMLPNHRAVAGISPDGGPVPPIVIWPEPAPEPTNDTTELRRQLAERSKLALRRPGTTGEEATSRERRTRRTAG